VKLKLLKMKKLVFTACAVGLGLTANLWAQVPSYVQKNGLVGWWPFNGNANDESGNGNNGTVNGATLTVDRFGNNSSAFSFNGINSRIQINDANSLDIQNGQSLSISTWIKHDLTSSNIDKYIISKYSGLLNTGAQYAIGTGISGQAYTTTQIAAGSQNWIELRGNNTINDGNWHHFVYIWRNGVNASIYVDNIHDTTRSHGLTGSLVNALNLQFGCGANLSQYYKGRLDEIGIWNRALTQQEITALYKGCGNEITSQPTNASLSAGTDAQFSVGAKSRSSYQWQSNPLNLGWHNISNNSTYSGATSNKLTISSTSVSSHNQPFRAIVNSSGCIDTSTVAKIIIGDTCLTTVTETLIINTTLSLPAPNNENTILIYPNPASDHITIDNGNFAAMAGYTIKIENNAGQQVFQSAINQQQFYVDLSTWSGNGLYFVHLIDPKNKTVTVRKIVLQ
jgi:hypothetical protein